MASKIKVDQLEGSTGSTITVPTGQTFTVTDGIPVASGGTGIASFTAGDILYATGATTLTKLTKGTAEQVLAMNTGATAPDWGSVDLTVLPTITVAKGGTNIASFTEGDILYATGATTLAKLAKGSGSDTLKMNSGATAPEWVTVAAASSDCVKLHSSTLSGGAETLIDVDSVFSSTYKVYKAYISGLYFGTGEFPKLGYLVGGTHQTSSYYAKGLTIYADYNSNTESGFNISNTVGYDIISFWDPNNTEVRANVELTFFNPNDNTYKQTIQWTATTRESGQYAQVVGYGFNDSVFSATGFRLTGSGGSIQDGCTISVYGFKY